MATIRRGVAPWLGETNLRAALCPGFLRGSLLGRGGWFASTPPGALIPSGQHCARGGTVASAVARTTDRWITCCGNAERARKTKWKGVMLFFSYSLNILFVLRAVFNSSNRRVWKILFTFFLLKIVVWNVVLLPTVRFISLGLLFRGCCNIGKWFFFQRLARIQQAEPDFPQ